MELSGLEGDLWRLRPPARTDRAAIAAHGRAGDALWIGIGPSAAPEQRAAEVLDELMTGADGDFGVAHLVVDKITGAIIGELGIHDRGEALEIVYGIAPAWRGRGIATEVLRAVTRQARALGPSRRLELVVARHNSASVRVAEKSGYRCIGRRTSRVEATNASYEDLVFVAP